MRKKYKTINAFVLLLSIFTFNAVAQLSGVYTINGGLGTTFPGGTNFQTFNALATALNTSGVSGPVTVNVVPGSGPYNEQVIFNQAVGSSLSNKITINGNNNLITFNSTSSAAPHTIGLNGADYMYFNQLNVQGQGTTYAFPLILFAGANYNSFTACTFSCNANGTSSSQIPVVVSGVGTSYSGASTSGNYNTWTGCEMFAGYFCFTMYGPSGAPYNTGNKVIDCTIRDFYYYGFYSLYQDNLLLKGNTIEKPNRTTLTGSTYGIYCSSITGSTIDGNKVRRLFDQNQTLTGTAYCIYIVGTTLAGYTEPTTIMNNIVSDIKWNGSMYGLMAYYMMEVKHNTLSFDHTASTGGTIYGYYFATTTARPVNAKNNLISCTKGGTGTKYGIYYTSTSLVTSDNNDIWMNSAGGNNFAGYFGGGQATLANLQTASSQEAASYSIDPVFTSIVADDLTPTSVPLNNLASPLGVVFDYNEAVRNQTTPDIGAIEFLTPACTGAPSSNTVTAPNYSICPGEDVSLGLAFLNSNSGFTYQWQSGTISGVGPFAPIAGANGLFYTAPSVTVNTWYSVIMTCTAPGGASIAPTGLVMVSGPTQGSIPYVEDFEGIGMNNRLPNCSWTASSLGAANKSYVSSNSGNRVPRSGISFCSFDNATSGTTAYYTMPITMNTGITYSAALYYATEYFGYANWTNLSILVGPNPSALNATVVASVGPAITGPYKLLDGLFTVPTGGNYYVAIRATSTAGSAQFLSWDDLSITIPCEAASPNAPNLTSSASSNTVCAGQNVSLNASGADTFTWSTGSNVPSTSDNPAYSSLGYTVYTVWGQNAITGCVAQSNQTVYVNPAPLVFVVASPPVVCAGKPVSLAAYGALSYVWSNALIGANITVSPLTNTSYTVIGTNAFGCSTSYGYNVTVNPLPSINAVSSDPDEACKNDVLTLQATGGLSYIWLSSSTPNVFVGNPITITSPVTTVFTVTGTNANGCEGKFTMTQVISDCTGLSKISGTDGMRIFPNPTAGEFTVEFNTNSNKTVEVTDVTGRVIVSSISTDSKVHVNIRNLAGGIYYVKVRSNDSVEVVKIVKQ